ncbi:unnamed protein product [Rhizophagus irregularis]|nr:unnamed protein product [Rhizophagus irregularis]
MQDYSTHIQYNEDNSVNVPFGRAAEWYIANHSLLKDRRLKSQSHELLEQINSKKRDKLCWSWIMYCAGDGNVGKCRAGCKNSESPNGLKSYQDIHLCKCTYSKKRKTNQIRKAKRGDRNEEAVLNEFNIASNTSYTNQSPTSSSTFQFPTPITITNFHPYLYNSYTNPLYNLSSSLHNTHTNSSLNGSYMHLANLYTHPPYTSSHIPFLPSSYPSSYPPS